MYKTLRLTLIGLFTLLTGTLMAQRTVTIDFDNDYQTLFPDLPGVSQGTDGHDGDFTEATTSSMVDNAVMVVVSPAEDAKTPSRIWSSSPRLRMYSGQFSVAAIGMITKIEFTSNDKFNMTALNGTLDGKTWTGNDNIVIFDVGGNTQLKKIEVTLDGGEVGPGPDDDSGYDIISGNINESDNKIVFDFVGKDKDSEAEVTGKMVFDFADGSCTNSTIAVTYPTEALAQAGYNDAVANAEKEGYSDIKLDGKTVSANTNSQFAGKPKIYVKYILAMILEENPFSGFGTENSPFSPTDAIVMSLMQEQGVATEENYYIKGKISSITFPFDTQHGTATFFISKDGSKTAEQFQVYSAYYLENKSWVDGYTQIKEGDDVIICGKLINYQGTPETASRKAYIYSLNGVKKAEGGETPDPEVQLITVSKALEIIDALENGKITTDKYQVKGYVISITEISTSWGNATFVMADSKADQTGLTVFRAKGFDNQNITDENLFKVGDEVVLEGKLQKYVKNDVITPELSSCYFISINGKGSGITDVQADTAAAKIYNLSGQRVKNAQKGLYIVNGKKVVLK